MVRGWYPLGTASAIFAPSARGSQAYSSKVQEATREATWPALQAFTGGPSGTFQTRSNPASRPELALAVGVRRSLVTPAGAGWPAWQAFIIGLNGSSQTSNNPGNRSEPVLAVSI